MRDPDRQIELRWRQERGRELEGVQEGNLGDQSLKLTGVGMHCVVEEGAERFVRAALLCRTSAVAVLRA